MEFNKFYIKTIKLTFDCYLLIINSKTVCLVLKKKYKYFKLKFQNCPGDNKKTWINLNAMFRLKNKSREICFNVCNNTWVIHCKQVSNVFNKYVSNLGRTANSDDE